MDYKPMIVGGLLLGGIGYLIYIQSKQRTKLFTTNQKASAAFPVFRGPEQDSVFIPEAAKRGVKKEDLQSMIVKRRNNLQIVNSFDGVGRIESVSVY